MRARGVRTAAGAFLLIPFLVVMASTKASYQVDSLKALVYALCAALGVLVFLFDSETRKARVIVPGSVFAYAAFLCLSLVSLAWSHRVFETPWYLAINCANLVLLFLAANAMGRPRELALVLPLLAATVLALSIVGFLERLKLLQPAGAFSAGRIISTMGNAGYLGAALAALLPAASALAMRAGGSKNGRPGIRRAVLLSLVPLAGLMALVFTGARAGLVAAAAGLGVFCLLVVFGLWPRTRGRALAAALILLGLVSMAALVAFSPAVFASLRPRDARPGSTFVELLSNRPAAWKTALSLWVSEGPRSILFGRGLGSYYPLGFMAFPSDYQLQSQAFSFRHAHNEYLELLAEGGLASLLSWLFFVGLALRRSLRAFSDVSQERPLRLLAAALFAGIIAILVQALVDPSLRTPGIEVLFYFFAGLAFSLPGQAAGRIFQGLGAALFRVAAGLLCAFSLIQSFGYFRVDVALQKGFQAQDAGAAASGFDHALELDPKNVFALYEKMRYFSTSPKETAALAGRIEASIPGFRQTALIKGMALAEDGRHAEAAQSLRLYLSQDSFNVAAYAYLAACQAMLGEADEAASSLGDFFRARHRFVMRWRDSYLGLEERELRLDPVGGQNRLSTEGGHLVAVLSLPCLRQIAGLLVARRDSGLKPVLQAVFLAMGGLYDELDYAGQGLAYYDQALAMGGVDQATQRAILEKYKAHIEKARQGLASARAAGDTVLEARCARALEGYLAFALRIAEDEKLLSEYRILTAERQAREGTAGSGP